MHVASKARVAYMTMFEPDADGRQPGSEVLRSGVDLIEACSATSEGSSNLVDQYRTCETPIQSLSNLEVHAATLY